MAEHDTKISKSKDGGLVVRCQPCGFAMAIQNEDEDDATAAAKSVAASHNSGPILAVEETTESETSSKS